MVIRKPDNIGQEAVDGLAQHAAALAYEQDADPTVEVYMDSTQSRTVDLGYEVTELTDWGLYLPEDDETEWEFVTKTDVTVQKKVARATRRNPADYKHIETKVVVMVRADWSDDSLGGDCEITVEQW